jgi:hypothetical protein
MTEEELNSKKQENSMKLRELLLEEKVRKFAKHEAMCSDIVDFLLEMTD